MRVDIFTDDINILKPIILEWQKEASGSEFNLSIDADCHLNDLQSLITNPDTSLLVLYDDDNKPIGYMGVMAYQSPVGKEIVAQERYYYVSPSNRGFGSIRLIKATMAWAAAKNCSHIQFSVNRMASNMHDRTCQLYAMLGMKHFETSFIKEL